MRTMASRRTPSKGTPKATPLKGKAALIKFLGIDPKDKNLSTEEQDNYKGWVDWMKEQVWMSTKERIRDGIRMRSFVCAAIAARPLRQHNPCVFRRTRRS